MTKTTLTRPFFMPETLTDSQHQALDISKTTIVEASAGSGKTTLLIQRLLAYLWQDPNLTLDRLLGITFTNKAAHELLHRLHTLMQHSPTDKPEQRSFKDRILRELHTAHLMTIHGFCHKLVMQFPLDLGIDPDFTLLDSDHTDLLIRESILDGIDQLKNERSPALKRCLLEWRMDRLVQMLSSCFSQVDAAKHWFSQYNNQQNAPSLDPQESHTLDLLLALGIVFDTTYARYLHLKQQQGVLDFNDLITLAHDGLKTHKHIRRHYQHHYRAILVDEFQDTDPLQWSIIQLITSETDPYTANKLFLVGDRFQSIYSFRGTHPTLFKDIITEAHDHPIQVVKATDNFRSRPELVDFFNGFFQSLFDKSAQFPTLIPRLSSQKTDPLHVAIFPESAAASLIDQSHFMAQWISRQLKKYPDRSLDDFAILVRRKRSLAIIKSVLDVYGLSSYIHSGSGLFEQQECIDIYNLVKGLTTPADDLAWIGVLSSPIFGISMSAIYRISEFSPTGSFLDRLSKAPLDDWASLESPEDIALLKRAKTLIPTWIQQSALTGYGNLTKTILDETQAWAIYATNGPQTIQNLNTLINKLTRWHQLSFYQWQDIPAVMDYHFNRPDIAAIENVSTSSDTIQLMTIHAAKGLEFPIVLLPELERSFNFSTMSPLIISPQSGLGISWGKQPNSIRKSVIDDQKTLITDEEKRLFYVACTRATTSLVFIGAHKKRPSPSFLSFLLETATEDSDRKRISFQFKDGTLSYPLHTDLLSPPKSSDHRHHTATHSSNTPPTVHPIPSLTPNHFRHLSTSALCEFLRCKKRYLYHDVLSTLDQSLGDLTHLDTLRSDDFGTLIHQVFSRLISSATPRTEDILKDAIKTYSPPPNDEMLSRILDQCDRFISSEWFRRCRDQQHHVEHPFHLQLQGMVVSGRWDLIYESSTGWHIMDFKTKDITAESLRESSNAYDTQLQLYALALKQRHNILTPITCHLYFTTSGLVHSTCYSPADLDGFYNSLSQLPETIASHDFSAPDRSICTTCPLFSIDPHCPTTPLSI